MMDIIKVLIAPIVNIFLKLVDWILIRVKKKKVCLNKLIANINTDNNERAELIADVYYKTCPFDFVGREKELSQLNDFVKHQFPALWWIISGRAGVGKSRLTFEFLKTLNSKKWDCKIISGKQFCSLIDVKPARLSLKKNMLLVIDEAYLYGHQVGETLSFLMSKYRGKKKLRVLILERVYSDYVSSIEHSNWENALLLGSYDDVALGSFKFKSNNLNLDVELKVSAARQIIKSVCQYYKIDTSESDYTRIFRKLELLRFDSNNILNIITCVLDHFKLHGVKNNLINSIVQYETIRLYRIFDAASIAERNAIFHIACVLGVTGKIQLNDDVLIEILDCFDMPSVRDKVIDKIICSGVCEIKYTQAGPTYVLQQLIPDYYSVHFLHQLTLKLDNSVYELFLKRLLAFGREKVILFLLRYLELYSIQLTTVIDKFEIMTKYLSRDDGTLPIRFIDDNDDIMDCGMLYHYICSSTNKHYIVCTNYEMQDGCQNAFAFISDPNDPYGIVQIETEMEWKIVEIILEEIEEKENLSFIEVYEQCNARIDSRVKQLFL